VDGRRSEPYSIPKNYRSLLNQIYRWEIQQIGKIMNASTQTIVNEVIETAKRVSKRFTQRFPDAASFVDGFRQGDIYLTLLKSVPAKAKLVKKPSLQLAPGTTQGSRHILASDDGLTVYAFSDANEFQGPILKLAKECELTHPEHGNFILPPGIYSVTYQRTQDALDRARRVED
jgi:hypothetical protein